MTLAWLPLLGLLLAVDAPAALPGEDSAAAPRAPADVPAAAKAVKRPANPFDVPLPPPPVLAPRPAAAKPAPKPVAPPPELVLPARPAAAKAAPPVAPLRPPAPSAAEIAEGERLIQHKCSKCHDLSWAPATELSDAQWRGHLKRPGVAVTDDQVVLIQQALRSRSARSASR